MGREPGSGLRPATRFFLLRCGARGRGRSWFPSGDYATGIGILAGLVASGLLACHAFCFMPTHYHVYGTFADVSKAIQKLNRRYAVAFNRRYGRRGHVFDSPFSRTPVEGRKQARQLLRYIALNPPAHERWPYASYPGPIGTGTVFAFVDPWPVLDLFGTVEIFRRFVDESRTAGAAGQDR